MNKNYIKYAAIFFIIIGIILANTGISFRKDDQEYLTKEEIKITNQNEEQNSNSSSTVYSGNNSTDNNKQNSAATNTQEKVNNIKNNTDKKMKTVTLKTNMGAITIELDYTNTPVTAENFAKLSGEKFYDGVRFHRVISGFMIQGGDPNSKDVNKKNMWGMGGPGYQFADEIKSTNSNVIGTISMANSGPNTNGSQFFINTANNNFLDPKHTVFGKVIAGLDIVKKIEATETDGRDMPLSDVIIESVEVK